MDHFWTDLAALATPAGALALANILFIDVVMSGDNAILIGMAVRKLQGRQRAQAVAFGVVLATVLRVGLAAAATFLLGVTGLKLAGGLLLLYVVWKFYRELRSPAHGADHAGPSRGGLLAAIWTIVVADLSMSLDNVLAVAGAAHGNFAALAIGLVVSIALMAFASNFIAKVLDRHAWVQWVGLVVILFVAVEMVLSGSGEVGAKLGGLPVLPGVVALACAAFVALHAKFVRPADDAAVQAWLGRHYVKILGGFLLALALLLAFADRVSGWLSGHQAVRYALLLVVLGALLELFALAKAASRSSWSGRWGCSSSRSSWRAPTSPRRWPSTRRAAGGGLSRCCRPPSTLPSSTWPGS